VALTPEEKAFHEQKTKIAKQMLDKLHTHPDAHQYEDEEGLVPPSAPLPDAHFKRRMLVNEVLTAAELYLVHDEVKDPKKKSNRTHSMNAPTGEVALADEIHPAVANALKETVDNMSYYEKSAVVKAQKSFKAASSSQGLSRLMSTPGATTTVAPTAKKSAPRASTTKHAYDAEETLHHEDPTLRSLQRSTTRASIAHDNAQKIADTGVDPAFAKRSCAHEKPVVEDPIGIRCVAHLNDKKWTDLARAIRDTIYDPDFYDDGTYAPMYVRLAIHGAATWDKDEQSGGQEGALMRFRPEYSDAHNKFCKHILKRQHELYKVNFPWATYADIQILASYVAIEVADGPVIPFSPGRRDAIPDGKDFVFLNYHERGDIGSEDEPCFSGNNNCPFLRKLAVMPGRVPAPEDGNLGPPRAYVPPEKEKKELTCVAEEIRRIFIERMGVTAQQTVALIAGGHSFGRCHREISGYAGPWQPNPGHFNNLYCRYLLEQEWKLVDSNMEDCSNDLITGVKPLGMRRQYVNMNGRGNIMMLVSDMALREDPEFGKWVRIYAEDGNKLKTDFAAAFKAATEFGFTPPTPKKGLSKLIFKLRVAWDDGLRALGRTCSSLCETDSGSKGGAVSSPKKGKPYKMEEVAKHNKANDCWVVINGNVCDLTKFKEERHPGGTAVIMGKAGTDASADWNQIHAPDALEKMAPDTIIGHIE